ncbi:MAG: cysteine--tRNA ligase [Spirochaetaceae bacterium]|nr:MAG: cysteine--tRNA ligase [Spirochaetaceae bacterium]
MSLQTYFPIELYNSKTRKIEKFEPIHPENVGMYVCGPTVYGDTHLGNARPAITFDVFFRFFTAYGYKVRYVRNITDVGHLEDEQAETGEDKIAKKARLAKIEPMEIAQRYTNQYRSLLANMHVLPPSIEPTASGHIIEQQEIVSRIIKAGYGYESGGSVYFDLKKFAKDHPYGGLSGKNMEELLSGTRNTVGQDQKHSPLDFALWKSADPAHIMRWASPWGEGFPGWHLECTAMSTKYLGENFDIHGGGLDLQFPHHEAEIAQNRAAFGKDPANFWVHNNMLTIDGQKMSKSLGNFVTLHELFSGTHILFSRPYDPITVRFFMLQAHYRSPIDLSDAALAAADKGLQRLHNGCHRIAKLADKEAIDNLTPDIELDFMRLDQNGQIIFQLDPDMHAKTWQHSNQDQASINNHQGDSDSDTLVSSLCSDCWTNMARDCNTPKTIATLFDMVKVCSQIEANEIDQPSPSSIQLLYETFHVFYFGILGLGYSNKPKDTKLDSLIKILIEQRNKARQEKNWQAADEIRDTLDSFGIKLLDSKDGTTYELTSGDLE